MSTTHDLACREFVELVTDYLEGVLPPALKTAFESHLEVCSGCRLYLGQMRLTIRALGARPNGGLSAETRQRLQEQFRAWRASTAE